ncbi:MAG: MFS transporter [Chloroflexota bacterium]|nr:MFS transporter [Chloroflexota bacterium]
MRPILFAAIRTVFNIIYRMIYPFLPVFSRALGVDIPALSQALANRYLVGALGPFLAAIADRQGRKAMMLFGIGLFVIGAGVLVVWPTFTGFVIMLILTALGKYSFDPSMQAYFSDRIPYQRRGRVLAITELGWSLSFIIGIPLVGVLISRRGWQSPFVWLALMGLISGGLLIWLIPKDSAPKANQPKIWRNIWDVLSYPPALAGLAVGLSASTANETINLIFGVWMEDAFELKIIALGATAAVIGFAELGGETLVGALVDGLGKVRAVSIGLGLNCIAALAFPLLGRNITGALIGLFLFYITFEFTLVSIIPMMTEILPAARATLMAFSIHQHVAGARFGGVGRGSVVCLGRGRQRRGCGDF